MVRITISKLQYCLLYQQEHSLRRDLEVCGFSGKESQIKATCKTTLFKKILHTRFRSQFHRRIYSFYRVTEAAIEAMTLIVVIVLIQIVTPRPNRPINLLNGKSCSYNVVQIRKSKCNYVVRQNY